MSRYSCAQLRDESAELALGVLSGAERAEAIMHVNGCARCQALVNELTETADALTLLAPEIEPSAGFEQRVLGAGRARNRRNVRRWVASIAAAAAAAAIVSITAVRVIEAGSDTTRAAVGGAPAEARMVSTGDLDAGWAYVTDKHGVAVAVDYGVPSGSYKVVVQPRTAGSVDIGTMAITNGRGSWTGTSPVALPAGSTISLVDAGGAPACHGTVARAD
jgi:anti-sigma factor RsiW